MKVLVLISAMFLSLDVWAQSKIFALNSAQTLELDVAEASDQDGEVTLKIQVQNPAGKAVEPKVTVIEEDLGFECKVSRILLNASSFQNETKTFHQEFLIKVQWSPGADQSHCLVGVHHPSTGTAKALLFMNWIGE